MKKQKIKKLKAKGSLRIKSANSVTKNKKKPLVKAMENALGKNGERFRSLFENTTIGIYRTTTDGRILMANPALVRMLGYQNFEELEQRDLNKTGFEPRYPRNEFKKFIERDGKISGFESAWKRKDGSTIFVRESAHVVRDENGQPLYYDGTAEDVTERKRVEEVLRESEEKYREVVERANDGILVIQDQKVKFVNSQLARMWGGKVEEIIGKDFIRFIHPDEVPKIVERYKRHMAGEDVSYQYETILLRKDGKKVYADINAGILQFEGRPADLVIVRDISERKQAQEKFKESEKRYRILFEGSNDAIFIMSEEKFVECNKMTLQMFGCEKEEDIIGHYPWEFSPSQQPDGKDSIEKARQFIHSAMEGTPQQFYWKHNKKNNALFDADVSLSRLEFENKIYLQAVVRDITMRMQSELLQDVVYKISQIADTSATLGALYKSVHEIISTFMQAKNFYISLYDQEKGLISFPYFIDEVDVLSPPVRYGKGLTEYVLRTGKPLLCDAATDIELRRRGEVEVLGAPSAIWLGVPLIVENKIIGVMAVQHYTDPNAYGKREQQMLEYVSSQVAKAIERKQAEEILRNSEKKFLRTFQDAPIMFCLTDFARGAFFEVNDAALRAFGFNREEVIGHSAIDLGLMTSEDRARLVEELLAHGRVIGLEMKLRSRGGREIIGLFGGERISISGRDSILMTMVDITQRKQLEQNLRESEKIARSLINASNDITILINASNNTIMDINEIAANKLGWKTSDLVGKNAAIVFPDNTRSTRLIKMKESIEKALPIQFEDERNGRYFYNRFNPITDENGKVIRIALFSSDITERKLVEETLRRSEVRMKAIVEGTPHLFFYTQDIEANNTYVSPTVKEITGYDVDIWLKRKDWFITDAKMNEIAKENTNAHLAGKFDKEPTLLEIRHAMGHSISLEVYEYPIILNGKVVGLQGVAHDITERKRAEEALRESENRYRDMVEQINDVLFTADVDGRFTYISPAVEQLGGYQQGDVIGHSMTEFIDPAFIPKIIEQFKKVIAGNLESSEYRVKTKSGEYRWIRTSSKSILENGLPVGIRGVLTDITVRKQAEESVNLLSHTVKSISECVSVTDMAKTILFVNQAFLDTFGYTEEEVLEKNINDIVSPTVLERQEVFITPIRGEWHGERIYRKKDGTEIPVFLSTSTVYDELGNPIALVDVATDITDQKKLQQQLLQAQKMESIGILAGGIAHDFNNILGIILGYASTLEHTAEDKEKILKSSRIIMQAVGRGAALVHQILTFARKTDLQLAPMSVIHLVHELLSMLRQTFPKVITFTEIIDRDIPLIHGDRSQIHQAMLNLCVNARDAMPNGGSITIKACTYAKDQVQARFPNAETDSYVCVSVSDTGEGMDEATRLRIFDPFFTTKEKGKGTGLGLAVVYGVVRTHHGFIDVESETGKGTTFQLFFPCPIESERKEDAPLVVESAVSGGAETILFVEDEDTLVKMICPLLEAKGYKVFTAQDGNEAIKEFIRHQKEIDIVLTDMGLPGMLGKEIFKKLHEIDPNVSVILASGFFEPDVKSELDKAGAKGFIQKPYTPDEVLRLLREVLDTKD